MSTARSGFHTWQRLPAGRMPMRRPQLEAAVFLAFAFAYVGFSWATGLVIRSHPHPILGARYLTSDLFYIVAFKLGGLLVLPLLLFAALGSRPRDVFAGDRLERREIVAIVFGFIAGALLNTSHFGPIVQASAHFDTRALIGRVALGIVIPLFSAALPEEIVYRGLLQPRLERVAGRVVAVLVTALLFTAWHLPTRFLLASGVEGHAGDFASVALGTGLPVFIVGLAFGLLYDRYRRLLPLIAAHWGIDAVVSVAAMVGLAA